MSRVLVTGANGFIGSILCPTLSEAGHQVRKAIRQLPSPDEGTYDANDTVVIGDIGALPDWTTALESIDVVVHLAARAHVIREEHADPLQEFRRINRDATLHLARAAAQQNVKRFVYLSTIGVHGDKPLSGTHLTEQSPAAPTRAYAVAKHEAELGLWDMNTNMEIVVIRPPLVYGPGVPGNFRRLLKLATLPLILPLGRIRNRRSFVYSRNLADFLRVCVEHPQAANETFLVSDDHDLSTTELIHKIAHHMGKNARLIPVPAGLVRFGARWVGKEQLAHQLWGSLSVDISRAKSTLNWTPPFSLDAGLGETVNWYQG